MSQHPDAEQILNRMRLAFDLYQTAEDLMRMQLKRRFPEADEAEIERHIRAWLAHRPGAEHGDAEGRPCQRDFGLPK